MAKPQTCWPTPSRPSSTSWARCPRQSAGTCAGRSSTGWARSPNERRRGRVRRSRILPAMTTAQARSGGIDRGEMVQLAAISGIAVLAIVLRVADASPVLVFVIAGVAVSGMAHLLGIATEQAGEAAGPRLSALLNATFGNAAEIIIVVLAIREGGELIDVARFSIIGSGLGNVLLIL